MKKFTIFIIIIAIAIAVIRYYELDIKILKRIYPEQYSSFVEKYAKENKIDKYLVYAIIKAESNFNEKAISSSGAIGLMQLMDTTAQEVSKKMDINFEKNKLYNPEDNIKIGTKYYSLLFEKYGNKEVSLMAYNAGSGNVDKWIQEGTVKKDGSDAENIPYKETNMYVRKILRDYKIYKKLYSK